MNKKEIEAIIEKMTGLVDEGIHVINAEAFSIIYSEAMSVLEKVKREDVLGKYFPVAFSHIPEGESTLLRALNKGEPTIEKVQTFLNLYGKEVTTMNTTVPIVVDGEIIAAMEVAKDITKIKHMSDTLLKLQEEYIDPPKVSQPKIRHYNFYDIIGENKHFRSTIEMAKKASKNNASVFIYGETGTGKELFAQSIHYDGLRKHGPFLGQNCAALPGNLLEGILFGTSKGGFTGAVDRAGLFEQANGGTLLLDEVSAMPYELQSKLLRVLQENYIRRVGGTKDIPVDVKVIATVNERPEELIGAGVLRKDLYFRLGVINLDIPPLRRRKDDIPLLVERLLDKQSRLLSKRIGGIEKDAMEKLKNYNYPGNVRELENVIMSTISMAEEGETLKKEHIRMDSLLPSVEEKDSRGDFLRGSEPLTDYLWRLERDILADALSHQEGNISRAAHDLGIKRQTLQHKMKKFNIQE
ncbi:MAG: sigma-54 interaction domain-containing protein [Anaerovoracaceae bacterium]|jgi:arginine utilization regulatory protein